jgi:hypothetical protein
MSGRTNNYKVIKEDIFNTIINPLKENGHKIDIFTSVWENEISREFIEDYKEYIKIADTETFHEYTPALIENYNEYIDLNSKYSSHVNVKTTMFFLYKINRLFKLVNEYEKINKIKYDYFIRLRPDTSLSKPISMELIENLDDSSIIVHVDKIMKINGTIVGCGDGWVDDNFCIAKKIPFEIYCNLYRDIIQLTNECKTGITHILLKRQFEIHGIQPKIPNSHLYIYHLNAKWNHFYYLY